MFVLWASHFVSRGSWVVLLWRGVGSAAEDAQRHISVYAAKSTLASSLALFLGHLLLKRLALCLSLTAMFCPHRATAHNRRDEFFLSTFVLVILDILLDVVVLNELE